MSTVGFLGTGRIATAMVAGWRASAAPPERVLLSPRNAQIAEALARQHPAVRVAGDNEEVVRGSDTVVVALPSDRVEAILRPLTFRADQQVISVVGLVPHERVQQLVIPAPVVRALPLPSISQGAGPIAVYPDSPWAITALDSLGEVLPLTDEEHLDAIWSSTAVIAAQIEQIAVLTRSLEKFGVPEQQTDSYVRGMLAAVYAHAASSPATLRELVEEAQTPGGLNAQVLTHLREAGVFTVLETAITDVQRRIHDGRRPIRNP